MQLTQVVMTENTLGKGLKAIEMKGLGQVVALFGPNGAGKSRLLATVKNYLAENEQAIGQAGRDRSSKLTQQVQQRNVSVNHLRDLLNPDAPPQLDEEDAKTRRTQLEQERTTLARLQESQNTHEMLRKRVGSSYSVEPTIAATCLELNFSGAGLMEVGSYQMNNLPASISSVSDWAGGGGFVKGVMPFLHQLAVAAFNATNPNAAGPKLNKWLKLYEEAQRIIKELIRMEFGYVMGELEGIPALNGRAISLSELSEGQKMLLIYTVCLLRGLLREAQDGTKPPTAEGAIVFVDEPELHLHPAATISLIESLRKIVGETGQIWVATHAVCLLPHLKEREVWTMYEAGVEGTGLGRKDAAVELLVGSEDNVRKLQDMLQEPAKWAAVEHTIESLLLPGQADYKAGDPQMFQIASVIRDRLATKEEVCILDCGAGKGRLAKTLHETLAEEDKALIKYLPVEPNTACHSEITESAEGMLADCGIVLHNEGIPPHYDDRIHVAVLCNVLHEIRPTRWAYELKIILNKLAEDGAIVICEDQSMPSGELPHELGYLVLGPHEIQALFTLDAAPVQRKTENAKYKERLLCVEIPKSGATITGESTRRAIEGLKGRLFSQIRDIRAKGIGKNATDGRRYAFHCQMLVNCDFALQEL